MKTEKKIIDESHTLQEFINEEKSFTISDYVRMFQSFICNSDNEFSFIYYECNKDDHTSREFINNINKINYLIEDGADIIRGFFVSGEKACELRYESYDAKKIKLYTSPVMEKTNGKK